MTNTGNAPEKPQQNKKITQVIIYIVLLLLALVIGLAIGGFFNKPKDDNNNTGDQKTPIAGDVSKYAEDQDYSDIEEADSIAVPGYDAFKFQAGKTKQTVTLHNPSENTCYFKMSLILEDGTTIWTSDLLEPGMAFTSIELNKALDKGTYSNVKLKYDCYSLKNQAQLNGAEIKVIIEVK